MKILERTISKRLARQLLCLVPEYELLRAWPCLDYRLDEVYQFARERDWSVFCYIKGRGAIFVRELQGKGN